MRKTLNLLIILAALPLLALPFAAQAQFQYTIADGQVTITDYAGFGGVVTIPESIDGDPVTDIATNAFGSNGEVTGVTIPDSVTNIGDAAFANCSVLENITVNSSNPSYASVDGVLFDKTQATLIQYPGGRTGSYAISNSVTTIGDYAFAGCNLTNVTIPDSVTSIGAYAFNYCPAMENITVNSANPSYASVGGVLFDKTLATLIQYPGGRTGSYAIPSGVTTICDQAFSSSSLTSVTLPDGVTNIGASAFEYCDGLTNVTISDSVTNIGDQAFAYCSAIENITVSSANPSYASVGGVLFNKTLTTLVEYPGGRTGSYAISNSVTTIGDAAFGTCGLTNVTIPASVTTIGDNAFNSSSLTSVTLLGSVTNIGAYAFASCHSLTSVEIPNSVTTIGAYAFIFCDGLTNVTIPDSVINIEDDAFVFCSSLSSVTIPGSVTNIGASAFYYCSDLLQAVFQGNAPSVDGVAGSVDTTVFSDAGKGKVYYVPGTTGWGATFGGWPTAQSYQPHPQILGSGDGLGTGSKGFQFTISWATNTSVVVEASTDLQHWTPVSTNALVNGTSAFVDSSWTNYPQRFYRVVSE
jgi:hypothetical protein